MVEIDWNWSLTSFDEGGGPVNLYQNNPCSQSHVMPIKIRMLRGSTGRRFARSMSVVHTSLRLKIRRLTSFYLETIPTSLESGNRRLILTQSQRRPRLKRRWEMTCYVAKRKKEKKRKKETTKKK